MTWTGKLNLLSGTSATITGTGWVIKQTAYMSGLSHDGTYAGMVNAAYTALLDSGYYIGKPLNFTDGDWPIILDQIDFSTLSQDQQEVGLTWRSRRYGTIRAQFSTGAAMDQTNTDYAGRPITVKYTYPESYIDSTKAGQTEETGAMVSKLIPERTVEITRTEWGPTYGYTAGYDIANIIYTRKMTYEGKVNSAGWTPIPNRIELFNQGCWLCTGINASTNDSGVTYDVSYSFAYRPPLTGTYGMTQIGGWNAEAVFIDPSTGRPPKDVGERVEGLSGDAAWRAVRIYDEIDFSTIWDVE